jgi:hypothetical protein
MGSKSRDEEKLGTNLGTAKSPKIGGPNGRCETIRGREWHGRAQGTRGKVFRASANADVFPLPA